MGAPMRYQPQASVRLNRSNPITRGLVVVLHPTQPGINLADGSPMVDAYGQGTSWTPAANSVGRAIANNSSPNYRIYSNGSWTAQNGSTTVVVATPRALVTSGAIMLEWSGSGGWNTVSLYMGDGTNPRWMAGTNASGLQYTTAPSNYAVGVPQTIVATATGNAQNLVINGAIVASTAYATGNPGYAHIFNLHSPSATARVVEVSLVLCWNRALTNDEAVSLSNNPWQIFDAGSASSSYQAAIASTGGAAPLGTAYTASTTDTLTLADLASARYFSAAQAADILSAADQAGASASAGAAGVDSLTTSDTTGFIGSGVAASADVLTVTDTQSAQTQALAALLDSLGVTDQAYVAGTSYTAAGSDTLTVGDLRSGQLTTAASSADSLSPIEALAASLLSAANATINPNLVTKSHWVAFEGGTRVVVFAGGTRVVTFESLGGVAVRTVRFDGGVHTVKFDGGTRVVTF